MTRIRYKITATALAIIFALFTVAVIPASPYHAATYPKVAAYGGGATGFMYYTPDDEMWHPQSMQLAFNLTLREEWNDPIYFCVSKDGVMQPNGENVYWDTDQMEKAGSLYYEGTVLCYESGLYAIHFHCGDQSYFTIWEYSYHHIDKNPPRVVDANIPSGVAKSKTITVTAADDASIEESGVERFALTTSAYPLPTYMQQQTSDQFTVSQNGTYYLWALDYTRQCSQPYEIIVTGIDNSNPVIDAIIPSVQNNNPPESNEMALNEIPVSFEITAHDVGTVGVDASGIDKIQYQLLAEGGTPDDGGWIDYNDAVRPTVNSEGGGIIAARAIDNVGNVSETVTRPYNIDATAPTGSYTVTPSTGTNGAVKITVTGTDTGTGMQDIKLPDGSFVTGDTAEYTVTGNGTYTFVLRDNYGNTTSYNVVVGNIDATEPTGSHTLSPSSWTKEAVAIAVTGIDADSGMQDIKLPDDSLVPGDTAVYTVIENGTYTFELRDNLGNITSYEVVVGNIDTTPPTGRHSLTPTTRASGAVTIAVTGTDAGSGMQDIKLPDDTIVPGDMAEYTVTENGTYTFELRDNCGNFTSYEVTVDNILAPSNSDSKNPGKSENSSSSESPSSSEDRSSSEVPSSSSPSKTPPATSDVSTSSTPSSQDSAASANAPRTGDAAMPVLWLVAAVVSGLGVLAMLVYRRQRAKKR